MIALSLAAAGPLYAQQLDTIQIRDNVWVIFGAGGNVTVHVGEDGVMLVDSGSEAMADRTLAAVKAITKAPIRMIINTSADSEHVGGNDKVAPRAVWRSTPTTSADEERATVLAHENVLQRMSAPKNRNEKPAPTGMWPTETFTSKLRSFYVNNEAVQVIRQLGAVTDGDVIVHFRRADVIATGDIVDLRRFPVIDPAQRRQHPGRARGAQSPARSDRAADAARAEGRTHAARAGTRPRRRTTASSWITATWSRPSSDIIEDHGQEGDDAASRSRRPTRPRATASGRAPSPDAWTTDMFVEAIYNGLKNAKPAGKTE